jgi:Na+-translocating ferredoxin:NAD+ oxidoreductase RnfG subunit
MKSSFGFVALPAAALIAPSAFAVQYLNVAQAQEAIFPGKQLAPASIKLTPAQRSVIQKKSRVRVLRNEQEVWRVKGGGWFIVDEVVGKHDFITYAVGLNADGSVKQIEVMEYRETYGYEIRNEKWRAQFVNKTANSPLKLDDDIKNISGATLSCRHITDGVKRLLAFYEVALR